MSTTISLELLGQMIQRLIDGQTMLRADVRQLRRKADRIERAVRALQRDALDEAEGEADTEAQIEALTRRIERLGGDVEQIRRRLDIAEVPS